MVGISVETGDRPMNVMNSATARRALGLSVWSQRVASTSHEACSTVAPYTANKAVIAMRASQAIARRVETTL